MAAFLVLVLSNLTCFSIIRAFNTWRTRKQELTEWRPATKNLIRDSIMSRMAGELHDPKTRWAAKTIKIRIRSFVNSRSFDYAVDGALNKNSAIRRTAASLKQGIIRTTPDSVFAPLPEHQRTIR